MKGISFNNLRVGSKYKLINFGEIYEFTVLSGLEGDNFSLKDMHTLETYELQDLIKYGKGNDFEIRQIN